jgi:methionyl-tRNA formyltransferase
MPTKGTINLHASLLPNYRGAAPINWAIINGEKETGVTSFFIQHEIDTGNILLQENIEIESDDTAGSLHDKLMDLGAKVILKTAHAIESDNFEAKKQDDTSATHKAPKIFTKDCRIDFGQEAQKVYDFIRGLSPYPGAWCNLNGETFKIYKAEIGEKIEEDNNQYKLSKKELKIATKDHWLIL